MDIEARFESAIQHFWTARAAQKKKQEDRGVIDAGTRGAVTGGTQMGAIEVLVTDILRESGLAHILIHTRTALGLPGYFRPEKKYESLCRRLVLERLYDATCLTLATNKYDTDEDFAAGSTPTLIG